MTTRLQDHKTTRLQVRGALIKKALLIYTSSIPNS